MADGSSTPLLGESHTSSSRPSTKRSNKSNLSQESTPLLSQSDDTPRYNGEEDYPSERDPSPAATSLRSIQDGGGPVKSKKEGRRWPTIAAITVLGLLMIAIITGVFLAPAVVEEYAKESLVIEPTNLSIHEITSSGVVARVQANFRMDASKVKNKHISNIGRFGTWIAREVETTESTVKVYVKSLDNLHVGTAVIPRLVVNIQNGHTTALDFLTTLHPGDTDGLRQVANDWLQGRLHEITLRGVGDIGLKSGLFSLGSQTLSEELRFEGSDIPSIPHYNITRMNLHEVPLSTGGRRGMAADVSISLINEYPIGLTIPPLGFDILVPNCGNDPLINLADATTGEIKVEPHSEVVVNVGGVVRELPSSLQKICPDSNSTPLDLLLGDYLNGREATIYVRGSNAPDPSTPDWITKILSSITIPVPFPGHTFDNLIKEFHLDNTTFSLPSPFADDGSDEANPRISSDILVIAGMPKEMNFGIDVSGIMATADVRYKGKMMGVLDLHKDWQKSHSERTEPDDGKAPTLNITSKIRNAPLRIKDEDVFEEVVAAYYFGRGVELEVKAKLDIEVTTVLGKFVIKNMPAEAIVPIKPISRGDGFDSLKPKVGELSILSTDKTTLNLQAVVNFTNPTEYSANIPFFNLHILCNGSILGDATITNMSVTKGNNSNLLVQSTWDPTKFGGEKGARIGRELISQYISGYNTTVTIQLHENSIPHQPLLGKALSKFAVTVPTPRLSSPSDGSDEPEDGEDGTAPHFIRDTIFHVFSSTAQFTFISPFQKSTMFIDKLNATAYYNHTDAIGNILYDFPFQIPPGVSESPKLPVDIDYDSVGYAQLRNALGGSLKLDAKGIVSVRLGLWTETLWYVGRGIGASVRF